jgi:predicted HTH domain antitoxin
MIGVHPIGGMKLLSNMEKQSVAIANPTENIVFLARMAQLAGHPLR